MAPQGSLYTSAIPHGIWFFGFTVATILVVRNFIRSSYGRACISIREDEIASEAMGVNTTKYKIIAFTLSSFLAGIGGALYASSFYMIQPANFGFMKSIDFLIIVVLGGMGSISGSVIAAVLLGFINAFLQDFAELRMVFTPLCLLLSCYSVLKGFWARRIILPYAHRFLLERPEKCKDEKGKGMRRWHYGIINS